MNLSQKLLGRRFVATGLLAAGLFLLSFGAQAQEQPLAPTILQIASGQDGRDVTINWSRVDHPLLDGYILRFEVNGSPGAAGADGTDAPTTSYEILLDKEDLPQLLVQLQGRDGADPPLPTGLQIATATGDRNIIIDWEGIGHPLLDGYILRFAVNDSPDNMDAESAGVLTTSYVILLEEADQLQARVQLQGQYRILPAPVSLQVTTDEDGQNAIISWEGAEHPLLNGYALRYEVNGSPESTRTENMDTATTSYEVPLGGVQQLRVWVRAWGYEGTKPYRSPWVEADWDNPWLPAPAGLQIAADEEGRSATISWDAVDHPLIDGYTLRMEVNGLPDAVPENLDAATTSYEVPLEGVEQLRVWVRAWGYEGTEPYRSPWAGADWNKAMMAVPANVSSPADAPLPTDTPPPTDTPLPTDTPPPTDTPLPTDTPPPTDTPSPTATPSPTDMFSPTITSSSPTDTPPPTNTATPVTSSSLPSARLSVPADSGWSPNVRSRGREAGPYLLNLDNHPFDDDGKVQTGRYADAGMIEFRLEERPVELSHHPNGDLLLHILDGEPAEAIGVTALAGGERGREFPQGAVVLEYGERSGRTITSGERQGETFTPFPDAASLDAASRAHSPSATHQRSAPTRGGVTLSPSPIATSPPPALVNYTEYRRAHGNLFCYQEQRECIKTCWQGTNICWSHRCDEWMIDPNCD